MQRTMTSEDPFTRHDEVRQGLISLPVVQRIALSASLCVFCTLPVSACQDVESDPLALAVAPETHGAVLLSQELPSLPHLLSSQGLSDEGAAEVQAWWESWGLSETEGQRLRSRIYPLAAQRLLPVLGEEGLSGVLGQNEETLRAVESVGPLFFPADPVRDRVTRARGLHQEALEAHERGEGEEALEYALQSVDALWELSPGQVADELVERASEAYRRIQDSSSYSQQELIRIRRLTLGAREALDDGDYPRAIRRAYYACQLLGVDPS